MARETNNEVETLPTSTPKIPTPVPTPIGQPVSAVTILKIFQEFTTDDIVDNVTRRVTSGMWSGNTGSLELFYTSSVQSASNGGQYFLDVYDKDPQIDSTAQVQFAVAYGNINGGGAPLISENDQSVEPTKAIYSQYKNILLEPEDLHFTFGGSYDCEDIYVINLERARLKQKMDPGNWELKLSGSDGFITLIDDSNDRLDTNVSAGGRIFNVVSGSLSAGIFSASSAEPSGGYGLFYPDRGFVLFNCDAVKNGIGLTPTRDSSSSAPLFGYRNHEGFLQAIQLGESFAARNEEIVSSTNYFVRVKNRSYNFSNNPTFYTSSDGSLKHPSFINDPKTFLTTIGLYNNSNELLAVAKLSKPVQKSFSTEALIKIRLDF